MEEPKRRIGMLTGGFMIGMAFLIDCLQFLLDLPVITSLLSSLLGFIAEIVFFFWFKILGVEYLGKGNITNALAIGGMGVISIIPELDGLPELTAGVATIVLTTYIEDTKNITEWKNSQNAGGRTRQQVMQDRRRQMQQPE